MTQKDCVDVRYLPEFVNEKFDPDKIYERILKLVNQLNAENAKLKVKIKSLKRNDNNTHEKDNDNESSFSINRSFTKGNMLDMWR